MGQVTPIVWGEQTRQTHISVQFRSVILRGVSGSTHLIFFARESLASVSRHLENLESRATALTGSSNTCHPQHPRFLICAPLTRQKLQE